MAKPVAGEVVVIPFPQTDLTLGKRRPALVIVDLPGQDVILCQITSRARSDNLSIALDRDDFERGQLNQPSFIRPQRLFTVEARVIIYSASCRQRFAQQPSAPSNRFDKKHNSTRLDSCRKPPISLPASQRRALPFRRISKAPCSISSCSSSIAEIRPPPPKMATPLGNALSPTLGHGQNWTLTCARRPSKVNSLSISTGCDLQDAPRFLAPLLQTRPSRAKGCPRSLPTLPD